MTITTVPAPADTMKADKYTASFIWVTPEIADRWLGRNERNRPKKNRARERYARDMASGEWAFTGEAIKFADDGRLLDGQNRLDAIVQTGVTLLMLVVRGLDQAAQDVMDTGTKRSASDMLDMAGKNNAALLGAVARLAVGWNSGELRTSGGHIAGEISHSEIRALVESDPVIEWAVSRASATRDISATPAARAFAAWLIGRVDAASARDFLDSVNEMRTNGAGDPRLTLIRRLQTSKDQKERLTSVEQAWLIVRAWDAWVNDLPLNRLQLTNRTGASPFPASVAS